MTPLANRTAKKATRTAAALVIMCCCSLFLSLALGRPLPGERSPRALLESDAIDPSSPAKGKGQYGVDKSSVTSPHKALLFVPQQSDGENATFPAVVFAHGLCGPANLYEDWLERLASHGYIVMANQEQEECKTPSIWNPFSIFDSIGNLRAQSDGKKMVQHVLEEADFLAARDDVRPNDMALVGHSMGGGAVIAAAAELASSHPNRIRSVVTVAPWNGSTFKNVPSSVAGNLGDTDLLILCSRNDQICPCSGEIGLATGIGSSWMSYSFLQTIFYTSDNTWQGGAQAIFDGAKGNKEANTTLVEFKSGGHFALAGISDDAIRKLGAQMSSGSGLGGFNQFFINAAVSSGEEVSNQSGDAAAKLGDQVLQYTLDFLKDTVQQPEEGNIATLVQQAKDNPDVAEVEQSTKA